MVVDVGMLVTGVWKYCMVLGSYHLPGYKRLGESANARVLVLALVCFYSLRYGLEMLKC